MAGGVEADQAGVHPPRREEDSPGKEDAVAAVRDGDALLDDRAAGC